MRTRQLLRDSPKICADPACERPMYSRGLCNLHYYRYQRDGRELPPALVKRREGICRADECSDKTFGRGFCCGHYTRWLKFGDIRIDDPKRMPSAGLCTINGCVKKRCARGLCHMHYERKRLRGDVGTVHSRNGTGSDHGGYLRMAAGGKRVMHHRSIMEANLGRPLLAHETVHHKDGDKRNNSLANLELWSSRHGKGQRVEDKLEFCRSFMADYGFHVPIIDASLLLSGVMSCV